MSASFTYCDRNFLSRSTLQTVVDVVRQMVNELVGALYACICVGYMIRACAPHPRLEPFPTQYNHQRHHKSQANMGFDSPFKKGPATEHDHNLAVLTAVICAGLYPGVATCVQSFISDRPNKSNEPTNKHQTPNTKPNQSQHRPNQTTQHNRPNHITQNRRGTGEVNFVTTCGKKAKLSQGSVNCYNGSRFTKAR